MDATSHMHPQSPSGLSRLFSPRLWRFGAARPGDINIDEAAPDAVDREYKGLLAARRGRVGLSAAARRAVAVSRRRAAAPQQKTSRRVCCNCGAGNSDREYLCWHCQVHRRCNECEADGLEERQLVKGYWDGTTQWSVPC